MQIMEVLYSDLPLHRKRYHSPRDRTCIITKSRIVDCETQQLQFIAYICVVNSVDIYRPVVFLLSSTPSDVISVANCDDDESTSTCLRNLPSRSIIYKPNFSIHYVCLTSISCTRRQQHASWKLRATLCSVTIATFDFGYFRAESWRKFSWNLIN